MAHIVKDRVRDTTTTTGTGNITLANSPPAGFRTVNAVAAASDTFDYVIEAVDGSGVPTGEWEVGLGTYSGSHVFVRTTVLDSSNAGAAVNFSAGAKNVFISLLANRLEASAAGAHPLIKPGSGRFFYPPMSTTLGTVTPAANRLYTFPMFFPRPTTWNRIGWRITGTHSSSVNVRAGLWNDRSSPTSVGPGTLIVDSGSVATTAIDTTHEVVISQILSGLVWIGIQFSATTVTGFGATIPQWVWNQFMGANSVQWFTVGAFYRDVGSFTAFGDESGNSFVQNNFQSLVPFLRNV